METCILDRRLRQFNWLTSFSLLYVCWYGQSTAPEYIYRTLSGIIIVALIYFTSKKMIKITADVVIFGCIMPLSFCNLYFNSFLGSRLLMHLIVFIPFFIWVFLGLKDGICILSSRYALHKKQTVLPQVFFIFMYTVLLLRVYWQNHLPFGESTDTWNQWNQIHGIIRYSDVHALGHTILLKLLLSIYDNYTIVIWVYVICTALLYCGFSAFLMKNGVPFAVLIIGITVFNSGLAPLNPMVYPWKDLPYSLCVGTLTLLLMSDSLAAIRGEDSQSTPKAMLYGLALAGSYLFRLNGILILIFVGVYQAYRYVRGKYFKNLVAMLLVAAALIAGTNWYGYQCLGAKHAENGFGIAVFGSGLAAAVNDGRATEAELEEIGGILPVEWMQEHYGGRNTRTLIWDPDDTLDDPEMVVYNNRFVVAMGKNPGAVIRLYIKLLPRHWRAYIKNIVFSTISVWGHSSMQQGMLYDNSTLLMLIGFVISVLFTKKMLESWIVLAPIGWNVISIAISAITNERRYLFPTVMLAPFILMYIWILRRESSIEIIEKKDTAI